MELFKHRYLDPARGEVPATVWKTGPEPIQATFKSGLVTAQASLSDTPTQGSCMALSGDKAFQTANSHRLALDAQDALAFTLVFLRAHTAAHGGKAVGALQDTVRLPLCHP